MPAHISSKSGKVKKSKLEKIFELETELKVTKLENYRLRKLVQEKQEQPDEVTTCSSSLSSDGENNPASESPQKVPPKPPLISPKVAKSPKLANKNTHDSHDSEKLERLKEAFTALKNVTVAQEKSLHNMRQKAQERRKEIQCKDKEITSLKKKVETLQKIQGGLAKAKCPDALQAELEDLQEAFFDEQTVTAKLELQLQEKEKTISSLQTVLKAKTQATRRGSEVSTSKSPTRGDDRMQLKRELGKKSKELVELQIQLESLKEELHEARLGCLETPKRNKVSESHVSESEFYDGTTRNFEDESCNHTGGIIVEVAAVTEKQVGDSSKPDEAARNANDTIAEDEHQKDEVQEGTDDDDDFDAYESFANDYGENSEVRVPEEQNYVGRSDPPGEGSLLKSGQDDHSVSTEECYIVD